MRQVKPLLWGAMLAAVWLLSSSDVAPDQYAGWTPYFMERAELERSVFVAPQARNISSPGKIWTDGSAVYIVERYKGVHIIDNSDPANPVNSAFIVAPGCMDVAVRGTVVYIDNAVDLVAFDMAANAGRGAVTKRLTNYFQEPVSPTGQRYGSNDRPPGMILVGWKQKEQEGRP